MKIYSIGGLGVGSNIYFIPNEIATLIDAGTGREFNQVVGKLDDLGVDIEDIDLLINTHCHFDHVGGDRKLMKASNCILTTHELTAKALKSGETEKTLATFFSSDLKPLKTSRILNEGDQVELGNVTLKVLHTPGHSEDSISLYEPREKVLFSGDVVFCMGVGRTDLPTSDLMAMEKTLKRLSKLEVEGLYPGHGAHAEHNGHRYIKRGLELLQRG